MFFNDLIVRKNVLMFSIGLIFRCWIAGKHIVCCGEIDSGAQANGAANLGPNDTFNPQEEKNTLIPPRK